MYKLLNIIDNNKIYTFNQLNIGRYNNMLKGNNINIGYIDTAMIIIPYNLCKNQIWSVYEYCADGYYIKECYENNKNKHIFIDNTLCYYNKISK